MNKSLRPDRFDLIVSRHELTIPFVRQAGVGECGPASLAMVLGFYGKAASSEELAGAMKRLPGGYSAKSLLDQARRFGLSAAAVKVRHIEVQGLPIPSILFVNRRHFVVFAGVSREGVSILDPGFGGYTASWSQFRTLFGGLALTFANEAKGRRRTKADLKASERV